MNFYDLDNKIKENKKYQIIATYIVENNISIESFLNNILTEDEKQGFFTRQLQGLGGSLDKFKGKIGNMWNRFRGNPTDVNSVIQILEKAREFLSKDPELQKNYDNEISSLAKTIEDIRNKGSKPIAEPTTGSVEEKPEVRPESEPKTEVTPSKADPALVKKYLSRFTYGNDSFNIDSQDNKESYYLYANELASYPDQNAIENVKNKLKNDLDSKIAEIEEKGVSFDGKNTTHFNRENTEQDKQLKLAWNSIKSKYLAHETWAIWDIGKQLYMSKNPSKSGEGYRLGDPITDKNIQDDIVDRMIGWTLSRFVPRSDKKKYTSKELTQMGKNAVEGKSIF